MDKNTDKAGAEHSAQAMRPVPRVVAFPLHIVQQIIDALEKLPMGEVAPLHADICRRITAAGYADSQRAGNATKKPKGD